MGARGDGLGHCAVVQTRGWALAGWIETGVLEADTEAPLTGRGASTCYRIIVLSGRLYGTSVLVSVT